MAGYLRYEIENIEPLRIADDSISQSGQAVSLRFIPGTTIRGFVLNQLAKKEDFCQKKSLLFSEKIRYLNAYPYINQHELIPSPKGFYEDKTEQVKKPIENVVIQGDFKEGYKRAKMGRFCYLEDGCIYYYNISTGSDMKIKTATAKDAQSVFRNEYIMPGYSFAGYIAIDDDGVLEDIQELFQGTMRLGNGRSQGLGLCKIKDCQIVDQCPYGQYAVEEEMENSCYLFLLSHMCMRDEAGEYTGLDVKALEKLLDIKNLKVKAAATSVVEVRGYNRVWHCKIPSVPMYEQGSVFHLTFDGVIRDEKLRQVMQKGIGIRKNEGFGRVLFFKNYENIKTKCEGKIQDAASDDVCQKMPEDDETLRVIASNYYNQLIQKKVHKHIMDSSNGVRFQANNSQVGNVLSILEQYRYNPEECINVLERYFDHAIEKEQNQKQHISRGSVKGIRETVNKVLLQKKFDEFLGISLTSVMGIDSDKLLSDSEWGLLKIDYLIQLFKYGMRSKEA